MRKRLCMSGADCATKCSGRSPTVLCEGDWRMPRTPQSFAMYEKVGYELRTALRRVLVERAVHAAELRTAPRCARVDTVSQCAKGMSRRQAHDATKCSFMEITSPACKADTARSARSIALQCAERLLISGAHCATKRSGRAPSMLFKAGRSTLRTPQSAAVCEIWAKALHYDELSSSAPCTQKSSAAYRQRHVDPSCAGFMCSRPVYCTKGLCQKHRALLNTNPSQIIVQVMHTSTHAARNAALHCANGLSTSPAHGATEFSRRAPSALCELDFGALCAQQNAAVSNKLCASPLHCVAKCCDRALRPDAKRHFARSACSKESKVLEAGVSAALCVTTCSCQRRRQSYVMRISVRSARSRALHFVVGLSESPAHCATVYEALVEHRWHYVQCSLAMLCMQENVGDWGRAVYEPRAQRCECPRREHSPRYVRCTFEGSACSRALQSAKWIIRLMSGNRVQCTQQNDTVRRRATQGPSALCYNLSCREFHPRNRKRGIAYSARKTASQCAEWPCMSQGHGIVEVLCEADCPCYALNRAQEDSPRSSKRLFAHFARSRVLQCARGLLTFARFPCDREPQSGSIWLHTGPAHSDTRVLVEQAACVIRCTAERFRISGAVGVMRSGPRHTPYAADRCGVKAVRATPVTVAPEARHKLTVSRHARSQREMQTASAALAKAAAASMAA
eukprot:gene12680-biopygen933